MNYYNSESSKNSSSSSIKRKKNSNRIHSLNKNKKVNTAYSFKSIDDNNLTNNELFRNNSDSKLNYKQNKDNKENENNTKKKITKPKPKINPKEVFPLNTKTLKALILIAELFLIIKA